MDLQDRTLARRYIELVKQAVFGEPGLDAELAFYVARHAGELGVDAGTIGWTASPRREWPELFENLLHARLRGWPFEDNPYFPLTLLGRLRLDNIEDCVESVLRDDVPGDLVECGVWRGGATILMRAMLAAYGVTDRSVWVVDSFAGLPKPAQIDGIDLSPEARPDLAVSRPQVEEAFARYGLLDDQVRFVEGFFAESLPTAPIEQIAVLRLDGDYYDSTMVPLRELYDRVSPGGYVIIDDYFVFRGCRQAVEEFRGERGDANRLVPIDEAGLYWRKGEPAAAARRRTAATGVAPPVVVSGVGGSGTRVFARVVLGLRWFLTPNRNESEDALDVADFELRWVPPYLGGVADLEEMEREFDEQLLPLLQPGGRWGWKCPASIHLLPFYETRLPGLRFIHVLRDGRDVALGDSPGTAVHTMRLAHAVLDGDTRPVDPDHPGWQTRPWPLPDGLMEGTPERRAAFWAAVNRRAADWGEQELGERYLRVRLEDLVARPRAEIERIARFLGVAADAGVEELVSRPESIGSWSSRDRLPAVLPRLEPELARFGYS